MTKSLNLRALTSPASNQSKSSEDRPKAELYLNIGVTIAVPSEETGETENMFISLPLGIPLDTLKMVNSNSNLAQAKNYLIKTLQEQGAQLQPGETIMIDGVAAEMRRVGEPTEGDPETNPLLAAMVSTLTPKAA
jgi:hypothetical protein